MGRPSESEAKILTKHGKRGTREKPISLEKLFSKLLIDLVRVAMEQIEQEREDQPVPSGLLSKKDAADYLAIGITFLDHLRVTGELTPVILGDGKWPKYSRKELDRYINSLVERQGR